MPELDHVAGLCPSCVHARRVGSARGSVFLLCGLSATDERYPKYPRLPVVRCAGYVARPPRTAEAPTDDAPRR
ncbi:MAG: hypothetical protein ACREMU_10775 [Gemmatimonadaceae bacterium]